MSDAAEKLLEQARQFYLGEGTRRDPQQAFELCQQAHDQGNHEAARLLGTFYEDGLVVERDIDQAMELYKSSIEGGFAHAFYNMGNLHFQQQDHETAIAHWAEGANNGDAYCVVSLGLCFEEGRIVKQDLAEAVRLYEHAAEAENTEGLIRLALCYRDGVGVQADADKMNELLSEAKTLNHPFAWYELGRQMLRGDEAAHEVVASPAMEYFETAAGLGQLEAMEVCGEVLCMGQQPDFQKGIPYLEAAVSGESPRAKYIMSILLASGKGVPVDFQEAHRLCDQAANAGEPNAMRMLGLMYERGDGVEAELETAKTWYQRAADAGDQLARQRLAELS